MKKLFIICCFITQLCFMNCGSNSKKTDSSVDKDSTSNSYFFIYLIVDGTVTKTNIQNVPKIDTGDVAKIIDKICQYQTMSSYLWVSYVDSFSENNKVEFVKIEHNPVLSECPQPIMNQSESSYDSILQVWKDDSIKILKKIEDNKKCYTVFKQCVQQLLYECYHPTGPQWSDVIGCTNIAIRTLSNKPGNNTKKYIILVSDGINNVNSKFDTIPSDIQILLVNGMGSRHNLGDKVKCMDNLQNTMELIFNNIME